MHVSQPAATRTIRELETAPDVKLFEFDDLKGPEYAPKQKLGQTAMMPESGRKLAVP